MSSAIHYYIIDTRLQDTTAACCRDRDCCSCRLLSCCRMASPLFRPFQLFLPAPLSTSLDKQCIFCLLTLRFVVFWIFVQQEEMNTFEFENRKKKKGRKKKGKFNSFFEYCNWIEWRTSRYEYPLGANRLNSLLDRKCDGLAAIPIPDPKRRTFFCPDGDTYERTHRSTNSCSYNGCPGYSHTSSYQRAY